MDPLGVLLGCALVLVVMLVLASCWLRANRLDRLHVRTDAARAALLAALERRAVVARSAALALGNERLRATAAGAEAAPPAEREAAENELSELLVGLDRDTLPDALSAELADAEQRVMLARRVHNDAVRDTLALRSRRLVRWLRLAGKAPEPSYFEIVDLDGEDEESAVVPPRPRRSARVVLLDSLGRVLLFEGVDPARPQESFWFTPGGERRAGEDGRAAALRELAEETGLRLSADQLIGPVWQRHTVFSFDGRNFAADEEFFVVHADLERVDLTGLAEGEAESVLGYGWWTDDELAKTEAVVYPRALGALLSALRGSQWDGVTKVVS